jgi:hypothetical protein
MAIVLGRNGAEPVTRIGWINLPESPFQASTAHARDAAGRRNI